jgi:tetratricopeptide (TPR) repeat protein
LANALVNADRPIEAIAHYDEAVRQNPDYVKAHYNLAWLLATTEAAKGGDAVRAVALAERACRLPAGRSAVALDILAAAYAAAGRFSEAVVAAEQAIQEATSAGNVPLARQIEVRLQLYRGGRAYRGSFGTQRPAI